MENKKRISIALAASIVIILLAAGLVFFQNKSDEKDKTHNNDAIKTESRVQVINGVTTIVLSREEQNNSGITTVKLVSAKHRTQLTAYGSVVAIQDLSKDFQSFETDKALLEKTKESLIISKRNYERTKSLFEKELASEQDYQSAQASYLSDEADVNSASANLNSLRSSLTEQWGDKLAKWIFTNSLELQRLLSLKDVLLQIFLPPGEMKIKAPESIYIQASTEQSKNTLCMYVSEGRIANSQFQTKTLYYTSPGQSLSGGINIKAYLTAGKKQTGVIVPSEAIIWYQGSAWVYTEAFPGKFSRVKIKTDNSTGDGFFVPAAGVLDPGTIIVKDGAQLLLSEELNSQTKNTSHGEGDDD